MARVARSTRVLAGCGAVAAVWAILLGSSVPGLGQGRPADPPKAAAKSAARAMSPSMASLQGIASFAPVLDEVIPSVVTMLVTSETLVPMELAAPDASGKAAAFPEPGRSLGRSGGSGVVVDAAAGLVLTNHHVIADATAIEVALADGRRYPGRVIGTDPGTDVAVVKVEATGLREIAMGDSDRARVGDVVLAIGNPYGLEGTATLGIISATMRSSIGHEAFEDFMQIDAAINPGNSGGALVNIRGELIGINTVGSAESGKAAGIGFAIPINMARTIMAQLVANGAMRRGSTGLVVEDLSRARIEAMGMRITRGVEVTGVEAGSPGAAAGVPVGAIITEAGGRPVRSAAEWTTRVATTPVGTRLPVRFEADGKAGTAEVTIAAFAQASPARVLGPEAATLAGVAVADIPPGDPLYGAVRGAMVKDVPEKAAARTSIRPGDVITAVEGQSIRSLDELTRRVANTGMQFQVTIRRDGRPAWVRVSR